MMEENKDKLPQDESWLREEVAIRHHFLKNGNKAPLPADALAQFKREHIYNSLSKRGLYAGLISAVAMFAIICMLGVSLLHNGGAQPDRVAGVKENVALKSVVTMRKEEKKIKLSDGTEVWLNADTRLTYPERFDGPERVVCLEGEAYFKVSKDKDHPFIVELGELSTHVLGTEFNVKGYSGEAPVVTLVSGKVKLTSADSKKSRVLRPGQQAKLKGHDFELTEIDADEYVEWKDGFFYYDNKPLEEMLGDMARWYDVRVVFRDESARNIRLHFEASRHESLENALMLLNSLNKVRATFNNGTIYIE